jgi:hypothetical protein
VSRGTNAIFLSFVFRNENDTALVDLEVHADLWFDDVDAAPLAKSDNGRGFIVYSRQNALSFIYRSSPLVTNVLTFWFGPHAQFAVNYWSEVTSTSFFGADSAIAFSWQGITVPKGETVSKSVIIRSGLARTNILSFLLVTADVRASIGYMSSTRIAAAVTSRDSNATVLIIAVVDSDVYTITLSAPVNK